MTLASHWFERSWERYHRRREKLAHFVTLKERLSGTNASNMVLAAYSVDDAILDVSLEQCVTVRNAIDLKMVLAINMLASLDTNELIERVRVAVDEHRAAGVFVEYIVERRTP